MRHVFERSTPFLKGIFGFILLAGCFAYAMFQGGFVSWFLFYSVSIVGVLIFLSSLFTTRIVPQRKLSADTFYTGDNVEVEVTFQKKLLQPFVYLRVQDIVPQSLGHSSGHQAMFFLSFKRNLTFRYQIHQLKRGHHNFKEMEVTTSDFFGWFERKHKVPAEMKLLVFPRYHKLGDVSAFQSQKQGQGFMAQPSFKEAEKSLAGVRDYVPGDRMTSINWKQSAKKKQLMTKEFETYQGKSTVIAFDPFSSKIPFKDFERCVEQVASIASTFIDAQIDCELAIHLEDWTVEEIKLHTWTTALSLLSTVDQNSNPAPVFHRMYKQWTNRTVYYICPQINEQVFSTLERLVIEKVDVKACLIEMEPDQVKMADRLRHKGIETIFISS